MGGRCGGHILWDVVSQGEGLELCPGSLCWVNPGKGMRK